MPKAELVIIEDVAGKVDVWTMGGDHIAASRTDREEHLQTTCFEQDEQIGLLKDSHKEMSGQLEKTRSSRDKTYRELEKSLSDLVSMSELINEHVSTNPLPKNWRDNLLAARDSIMERGV